MVVVFCLTCSAIFARACCAELSADLSSYPGIAHLIMALVVLGLVSSFLYLTFSVIVHFLHLRLRYVLRSKIAQTVLKCNLFRTTSLLSGESLNVTDLEVRIGLRVAVLTIGLLLIFGIEYGNTDTTYHSKLLLPSS